MLSDRLAGALIGLGQGVVFWAAYETLQAEAADPALAMAAVAFAASAGVVANFAWTARDHGRLAAVAVALGAVLALLAYWVWAQIPDASELFTGDAFRSFTFPTAATVCLYVLLPFAQVFQRTGRLRFPYRDLFFHAWTNAFVGAMGLVYAGVFLVLVRLWAALFDLIGIHFFSLIFDSEPWNFVSLPAVAGYGLATGRENSRFPDAGRAAALTVFRFLMPLLAVILLLFLGALPFTGLRPLWATGNASALLLGLAGLVVLFLNAVIEDGEGEPPYTPAVRRGIEVAVAAVPIVCAIAAYATWLRLDQYGVSPQRVYGIVFCAIASAFALAYAAAVFVRRGRWLGFVRPANVALSLAVVAIALLLHTPVLDPLRLCARNQVARLLDGRVDAATFDFSSLRFHLGHAGLAALARLEAATEHPEHAKISELVATARSQEYYGEEEARFRTEDLRLIAPLTAVPEGLDEFLETKLERWYWVCGADRPCALFLVDFDGDGTHEVCLASGSADWSPTPCFARAPEGWRRVGFLAGESGSVDASDLQTHSPEPVPPRQRDVRIGERVYRLVPEKLTE